ncbi:MAG: hypothetical protein R3F35_13530 [Myxococcota bacterium]
MNASLSWQSAYAGALQSVWALLALPLAFLAWRLAAPTELARARVPRAARLVAVATLVFACETILDPIATGPWLRSEALRGTWATSVVPFVFVYLGDWRVLLLVLGVARTDLPLSAILLRSAATTTIVPIGAGSLYALVRWRLRDVDGQWLWMGYEAGFLGLCVLGARIWLPRVATGVEARSFVRTLFGFSAAYYALWLAADVLIVVLGLDLGWAIRMLPNQLYYAVWAPFVYFRFFSAALPVPATTPNAER